MEVHGEAVSLAVVENIATALWPDNAHAAVAVPDGRKGEQIVLVTDAQEARRMDMIGWAQNHGVAELTVPRTSPLKVKVKGFAAACACESAGVQQNTTAAASINSTATLNWR